MKHETRIFLISSNAHNRRTFNARAAKRSSQLFIVRSRLPKTTRVRRRGMEDELPPAA
jgi:hypothetical protein